MMEKPHCLPWETPGEYFDRTGVRVRSNAEWNAIIEASGITEEQVKEAREKALRGD